MEKPKIDRAEFDKALEEMAETVKRATMERCAKMFKALTDDEQRAFSVRGDRVEYIRLARTLIVADSDDLMEREIMVESMKPDVKRMRRILNSRYW